MVVGGVWFVCLCFGFFCVVVWLCMYVCMFVCLLVFVFIVVVLLSVSFLGCSLLEFLCGWLLSLVVCRWLLGFGCGWCRRLFFLFFVTTPWIPLFEPSLVVSTFVIWTLFGSHR